MQTHQTVHPPFPIPDPQPAARHVIACVDRSGYAEKIVPHALAVSIHDLLFPLRIPACGGPVQFLAHRIDGEAVVEIAEPLQKRIAIQGRRFGPVGFLDEKMEVVGHHRVGDNAESEKSFEFAHEDNKVFPLLVSENELPVHDAGEAVVVAESFSPNACLSRRRNGGSKKGASTIKS